MSGFNQRRSRDEIRGIHDSPG